MAAGRKPSVTDKEIVAQFCESDDPFLSASELADELSFTRQGMNQRLRTLLEKGILKRKKCGNGYGWWLNDDYCDSDSKT